MSLVIVFRAPDHHTSGRGGLIFMVAMMVGVGSGHRWRLSRADWDRFIPNSRLSNFHLAFHRAGAASLIACFIPILLDKNSGALLARRRSS